MTSEKTSPKNISSAFNRWLYGGFLVFGIYFLIRGEIMNAASNFGIALIFDPFDQAVKWNDRKPYQRIWLFVHVAIVLALFLIGLLK
ncbi:MAG: hypothetical protein ACKVOM_12255 [Ferruginibacter sp.]